VFFVFGLGGGGGGLGLGRVRRRNLLLPRRGEKRGLLKEALVTRRPHRQGGRGSLQLSFTRGIRWGLGPPLKDAVPTLFEGRKNG